MLLFHPNQMLVQTHRPFFTRFYRSPKNQIPHHYLLCFRVLESRVRSSVHRKIELNPKPGTRTFLMTRDMPDPFSCQVFSAVGLFSSAIVEVPAVNWSKANQQNGALTSKWDFRI